MGLVFRSRRRSGKRQTVGFESLSNVNWVTLFESESWTVGVPDARLNGSAVDDNCRPVDPKSGNCTSRHVLVAT